MAECDQCHEWFHKKCESIPDGEVGWGLMMVLLWPHSWSKFISLFNYLSSRCMYFMFLFFINDKLKQKQKQKNSRYGLATTEIKHGIARSECCSP